MKKTERVDLQRFQRGEEHVGVEMKGLKLTEENTNLVVFENEIRLEGVWTESW